MGWTSKQYIGDSEHTTITKKEAFELVQREFNTTPLMSHFLQANNEYDHNELYSIFETPNGQEFIGVTLIDIKDGDIYWKFIEESHGPSYANCDPALFKLVFCPNELAKSWRNTCKSRWGINKTQQKA